jgi:hypothetical protein
LRGPALSRPWRPSIFAPPAIQGCALRFGRTGRGGQAQHQYIYRGERNGAEVWRRERADSSIYGFDICVTRVGMSMTGDIGSLVF